MKSQLPGDLTPTHAALRLAVPQFEAARWRSILESNGFFVDEVSAASGQVDLVVWVPLDQVSLESRDNHVKDRLVKTVVERDGHLPLAFTGRLLGLNDQGTSTTKGTLVRIFVTQGGKIVTAVHQWQKDELRERERHAAEAHDTPGAALEWLIKDGGGHLGKASREAWSRACRSWPALRSHECVVVE